MGGVKTIALTVTPAAIVTVGETEMPVRVKAMTVAGIEAVVARGHASGTRDMIDTGTIQKEETETARKKLHNAAPFLVGVEGTGEEGVRRN